MLYIFLALSVNVILSLVISNASKSRECNPTWIFWASFLFSPIVGMFLVLASKEKDPNKPTKEVVESTWEQKPDWIQENPEKVDRGLTFVFGILALLFLFSVASCKKEILPENPISGEILIKEIVDSLGDKILSRTQFIYGENESLEIWRDLYNSEGSIVGEYLTEIEYNGLNLIDHTRYNKILPDGSEYDLDGVEEYYCSSQGICDSTIDAGKSTSHKNGTSRIREWYQKNVYVRGSNPHIITTTWQIDDGDTTYYPTTIGNFTDDSLSAVLYNLSLSATEYSSIERPSYLYKIRPKYPSVSLNPQVNTTNEYLPSRVYSIGYDNNSMSPYINYNQWTDYEYIFDNKGRLHKEYLTRNGVEEIKNTTYIYTNEGF